MFSWFFIVTQPQLQFCPRWCLRFVGFGGHPLLLHRALTKNSWGTTTKKCKCFQLACHGNKVQSLKSPQFRNLKQESKRLTFCRQSMFKFSTILHLQRWVSCELRLNFHCYVCSKFIQLQSKVCVKSVHDNVSLRFPEDVFDEMCWFVENDNMSHASLVLWYCSHVSPIVSSMRGSPATSCSRKLLEGPAMIPALVFWTVVSWEIYVYIVYGTLLLPS